MHGLDDRYRQLFVVPLEGSLLGRAVLGGETVAVDDVDAESTTADRVGGGGGYRSFLAVPLESYRGTYGALAVLL